MLTVARGRVVIALLTALLVAALPDLPQAAPIEYGFNLQGSGFFLGGPSTSLSDYTAFDSKTASSLAGSASGSISVISSPDDVPHPHIGASSQATLTGGLVAVSDVFAGFTDEIKIDVIGLAPGTLIDIELNFLTTSAFDFDCVNGSGGLKSTAAIAGVVGVTHIFSPCEPAVGGSTLMFDTVPGQMLTGTFYPLQTTMTIGTNVSGTPANGFVADAFFQALNSAEPWINVLTPGIATITSTSGSLYLAPPPPSTPVPGPSGLSLLVTGVVATAFEVWRQRFGKASHRHAGRADR
jgi:hypothetical protein